MPDRFLDLLSASISVIPINPLFNRETQCLYYLSPRSVFLYPPRLEGRKQCVLYYGQK